MFFLVIGVSMQANKLLLEAHLEPNWLIRAVRAFDDMDAVLTRFGVGFVVGFRAEDGVYEASASSISCDAVEDMYRTVISTEVMPYHAWI